MKENIIKYSPVIVTVVCILIQWNVFVTPEKLEIKHREIMTDVSQSYVTKDQYNAQLTDLKSQISDIQKKIDKIYDIISKNNS